MFASLNKWNPKTLLANYLASQLAEFFDVDPNEIESDLLTNAYIKLQKIRVHPYVLNVEGGDPVVCEGWVETIEFRWTWGTGFGEGAKAYIQDTQLHVSGIQLRLYQSANPPPGAHRVSDLENNTPPPTPAADPDWKARYLQQIVDSLLLIVESIDISVELSGYENLPCTLRVAAEKMELVTLGGASETPNGESDGLRQRLSLGTFLAFIEQPSDSETSTRIPLLDPIGYRALVQRVSGRRFIDGIGSGLVITGENILDGSGPNSDSTKRTQAGLRFHAGIHQIWCLLQLQRMLGFEDDGKAQATSTSATESSTEARSSLLVLPVPSLSLILQNDTDMRVDECVITLHSDGSSCCVETNGSFYVNESLVNHTTAGSWKVDLLRSDVIVKSHASSKDIENEGTLTELELHVDQCRALYNGFAALFPLFDESGPKENATPWNFHVDGCAAMALVDSSGKKLSARVMHPRVRCIASSSDQPVPGLPVVCAWGLIDIQSSDLGNVRLSVPPVDSSLDGQAMTFSDPATVSLASLDDFQSVLDFVGEFTSIIGGESTGVPLTIKLAGFDLHVDEDDISVKLVDVVAHGYAVSAREMSGTMGLSSFALQGLECDAFSMEMSIDQLSTVSLTGVASLAKPVVDLKLKWKPTGNSGVAILQANSVSIIKQNSSPGKNQTFSAFDVKVPVAAEMSIGLIELYEDAITKKLSVIGSAHVKAIPVDAQESSLSVAWKSLQYQNYYVAGGSLGLSFGTNGFDVSMHACNLGWKSSTSLDGFGKVESIKCKAQFRPIDSVIYHQVGYPIETLNVCMPRAEVKLNNCSELRIPDVGFLASPIESLTISFSGTVVEAVVGDMHWQQNVEEKEKSDDIVGATELAEVLRYPVEIRMGHLRFDSALPTAIEPTFGFKNLHLKLAAANLTTLLVPFEIRNFHDIWYLQEMIQAPSIDIDGKFDLKRLNVIQQLDLKLSSMFLSADFSLDMLTQKADASVPVPLPHSKISSFDLHLKSKGKLLVMKGATVNCSKFSGDETSTSESVTKHYIQVFKKRIPYLLSAADIGGVNVGDSIGMVAARTAMRSSVVGSVVGVGARDAVGGAISLGKQSRGATESQKYHFGDFSRGVVAASRLAAKKPASVSSAAGDYTSRNRERLGGAAGSGAAMIAGAVIAGPIGLIAGSVVGGMAGQRAVKSTFGEYQDDKAPGDSQEKAQFQESRPTGVAEASSVASPHHHSYTHQNQAGLSSSMVTQVTNDPFAPSSPQMTCTSFSQPCTDTSIDPFSVFETPSQAPPVPEFTAPPDDPLAFFASQDAAAVQPSHANQMGNQTRMPRSEEALTSALPRQDTDAPPNHPAPPAGQSPWRPQVAATSAEQQQPRSYRFGDLTRGIVAKGKQKRGGEGSNYKFGDFTRGLFK